MCQSIVTMRLTRKEIAEMIRSRGYRATPQRVAIYEAVWRAGSHPTVAEIYEYATKSDPSISLATVYNTLHLLEEIGLVQELSARDGSARYDPDVHFHINIVCRSCGKVVDYEYKPLDKLAKDIQEVTGFGITVPVFEVKGLCSDCRAENQETAIASVREM